MFKYTIESSLKEAGVLHLTLKSRYQDQIVYFTPGQYVCISFKKNGRKSPYRCFSITSVPGSDTLELGIKIGGNFTKVLSKLPKGTEVEIIGPFGDFVVDKDQDEYLVFIAGGIGITPYISIIRTLLETKYKIPILLLYSSGYSSAMPYIDELIELSKRHSNFTLIPFVTTKEDKKLDIKTVNGIIEKSHIEKIVKKDYLTNTYFICGPKLFTTNIVSYLEGLGISEERIITESFSESSQIRTISGKSLYKLTYLASGALVVLGIIAIGLLDLVRYVPNHLPKAVAPTPSNDQSNSATLINNSDYQAPVSRSS